MVLCKACEDFEPERTFVREDSKSEHNAAEDRFRNDFTTKKSRPFPTGIRLWFSFAIFLH